MLEYLANILPWDWPIVTFGVLGVVSLLALLTLSVRISRFQKKVRTEFDKLDRQTQILTSGSLGMGEKLVQLEAQLASALNNQHIAGETEAQFSYTQALKLIESGVDHSLITSNCGLSDSEVSLMELLHNTRNQNRDKQVLQNESGSF